MFSAMKSENNEGVIDRTRCYLKENYSHETTGMNVCVHGGGVLSLLNIPSHQLSNHVRGVSKP